MATCQHYAHVLNDYNDEELTDVIWVALGKYPAGKDSASIKRYKEVQIHGEVRFDKNVQCMFYSQKEIISAGKKRGIVERDLKSFKARFKGIEVVKIEDYE